MIIIKKSEFQKLYDISCEDWTKILNEKLQPFIFSDEIQFEESFVEKMKKACTKEQLLVFNNVFKNYLPKDITQEVYNLKTLKSKVKDFKFPYSEKTTDKLEKSINALYLLTHVASIYNQGEVLGWKNSNIYKYLPYRYFSGGSALVGDSSGWCSCVCCCSGLYYKNSKLSGASYNNFTSYWEDFWGV